MRDNILLRIYPDILKFQLDRLGQAETGKIDSEYVQIKGKAIQSKMLYGVFGYIRLKKCSYLILIEEASIVG